MTDPRVFTAPNPAAERSATVQPPSGAGDTALWFATLGPAAAWSVDSLAAIAVDHDYCAALLGRIPELRPWSGATLLLVGIGVAMFIISLAGGAIAWRAHTSLGDDTGQGDTDVDRRRFMARAALLSCALFSYGILLRTITLAFLSPRFCGS
jgi:hypothetical protein